MNLRFLLPLASLLALAPLGATQGFTTIAFESFDYPVGTGMHAQTGGSGWSNAWWAGDPPTFSPVDHSIVVAPSLDGVGNAAEDQLGDMGTFRFPDTAGHEQLLDYATDANGLFGKDDTTLWISFYSRRSPGGDDQFGGMMLNHQFVTEHVFLGAANSWLMWGVHDDPWGVSGAGGNVVTNVLGSNIDQNTHLVYRLDFLAGQERLRLWLDPAVDHPDTVPDMDVMIHDFRFNEIGLKSGNELSVHGWLYDGIEISTPNIGVGTAYCFGDGGAGVDCPCGNVSPAGSGCVNGSGNGALLSATGAAKISGDTLVLHSNGLVPNQPGLYFQGDNMVNSGAGVIFGDGLRCAGGGVIRMQVAVADSNGESQTSASLAAVTGVMAGDAKRYQLWYRDPVLSPCASGFNFSNGLEVTWEP